MKSIGWVFVLFVVVLSSCAPSRFVRPLDKGEKQISANIGGPMINFAGAPIIVPLTGVTYGAGISNSVTMWGTLHTTALGFGVVQGEIGVVKGIKFPDSLNTRKPGFSISHTSNFAVDTWEGNFRFWPQIDANMYWNYSLSNRNYMYLGVSNWFELSAKRPHNEPIDKRWIPSLQLGHVFDRKKWQYTLEAKYLAPFSTNNYTVVDYVKPFGNKGGLGIYIGITKKIGK